MRATSIIFRREMAAYLRSPLGYVVAALMLLICGVLFQALALDDKARLSAEVLSRFFYLCSGTTMAAGIALSFHLIAEERQQNTVVLLTTSPVRDVEIVLGKFLAAFVFLSVIVLLSFYMPLLIKVRGKISFEQVVVGYLGLLLLGGASLSIGLFASSLTRNQVVAILVGGALLALMIMFYHLGRVLDPPLKEVFAELGLYQRHFGNPQTRSGFMNGIFNLKDVIYYFAVIYFFLLLATKTMEAKRWQ